MNGEERKLLTEFIGDFREFRGEMNEHLRHVDSSLVSINKRLDEGNRTFQSLKSASFEIKHDLEDHEKRLGRREEGHPRWDEALGEGAHRC